jgi:gluconolactonase
VLGLTLEGEELCRFEDVGRAAMLWPNDVCVGPDGFLYVTDSGTRPEIHVPGGVLRPDYESAAYDGRIFRIDPATGVGAILDRGLRFVNGVAFGPDGMLYVSETLTGNIYRYALDSRTARRQLFGNVLEPAWGGGFRGPDGMAFSIDGRLWVAVYGQGDVTVMDGNGVVCERLLTRGRSPANVAFARAQPNRLAVADHEHGALEFHEVAAEGFL